MQRISVESSDLVSVGYDAKQRILEIEFREGRIYQYKDVTPEIYEHLMRADSYGQYFYASINGRYRYSRVDEATQLAVNHDALAFVTNDVRKVGELQRACAQYAIAIKQLDLQVDEMQSHDPAEVALKKVKAAYKLAGRPVLVQDTFWNILSLRGFPGAYMNYVAAWLTTDDLLRLMAGKSDRTTGYTYTLAYYDGKRSKLCSKDYWGVISEAPHGNGMPIEQIMVPNGQTKTLAELYAEGGGESGPPLEEDVWREFAKWYNLKRRTGLA
jgi:non-canonical purine NTP pyrophosphatase (RdgB/HAM1 family)